MATIHQFEELDIWQLSRILYQKVYILSEHLRKKHEYRFAEQIETAAGSIMDNIADCFERSSHQEFLNSLSISKGECGEVKSKLYRCFDDGYITEEQFKEYYEYADKVSKKIANFVKYLNNAEIRGLKFKDREQPKR